MKIFLATSNLGKVKEFREKLINSDITIDHVEIPYPEIQSDSLEEIAKYGAKFLANKINEIVTVEDSGLFIDKRTTGSISWTLTLLITGLVLGCWNAWHWINKETKEIEKEREEIGDEND